MCFISFVSTSLLINKILCIHWAVNIILWRPNIIQLKSIIQIRKSFLHYFICYPISFSWLEDKADLLKLIYSQVYKDSSSTSYTSSLLMFLMSFLESDSKISLFYLKIFIFSMAISLPLILSEFLLLVIRFCVISY